MERQERGCIVRKAGWRSVYDDDKEYTVLPDWNEGDTLAMNGCSMSSGMTRPKPLHTESTLLAAMETAGREGMEDEEVRQALKDCALPVFRQIAGRTLTDTEMNGLLANGKTGVLGGFKSKQGKPFSAAVAFDADFNTKFIFPENKSTRKSINKRGGRK